MKKNIRGSKRSTSNSSRCNRRRRKKIKAKREASVVEVEAEAEDEVEAKFGHYASECRAPSSKVNERSNYVEVKTEENETVLLACRDNDGDQENTWYLDTGVSNHMCGRRSMFVELDESVAGNVSFGDDSKISVKGKGNILIRAKNGSHQLISNVYYVPNMIIDLKPLVAAAFPI
ncbi:hypothetical protein ACOSQ2_003741 [Xanthoceras sorbifolium]